MGDVNEEPNPRYTDHEFDAESGLNYMKGRYQLANFAKFNRPDPMRDWDWENPSSINLYQYVRNNPIESWDPDGFSPVSMFIKMAAKRGLKKAAKEMVGKAVKNKLKSYGSKKWAKTFADDALTAIDLATGQAWWEYAVEFIPYAGDVYSGVKMTKQAQAVYGIVNKFETMAGYAGTAANKAWSTIKLNRDLTGKGSGLIEKAVKKANNVGKGLQEHDLAGAVRDIFGQAVRKSEGGTFEHLEEVTNSLKGLGKLLNDLRKKIDTGAFEGDSLKAAESFYKELSKRKDEVQKVLNQAREAVKK